MSLAEYFSVYAQMSEADQRELDVNARLQKVAPGTVLHNGEEDCLGVLIIRSGQLRACMISDEGREITLYRLFERDICLFSASCMMKSIQFDITITAEKETEFWLIDTALYTELMRRDVHVANYTNQLMATRFTDVMWLMEQIMWKSFDARLAGFLLEESAIEETCVMKLTHEKIAAHLGTAREVVTRMLKYFQSEGMVRLTRGAVEITDSRQLSKLAHK